MSIFYKFNQTYRVRIDRVTLTQLGQNNTDAIVFDITVLGELNASGGVDPVQQYDREITKWLSEKAQEHTVKDLISLGYSHDDLNHLDELEGKEVDAYCKQRTDANKQPQDFEEWNFSRSGGGKREVKPLEQSGRMKLNALLGRKFAEARASQVNSPQATSARQEKAAAMAKEAEDRF